jgi:hypothetical protein
MEATRTIKLPVSGKEAVIRAADGYAENILIRGMENLGRAYPQYWASLTEQLGDKIKPTTEDILKLYVPDQQFMAIENYRHTMGDIINLKTEDPKTGKPESFQVDLSKLDLKRLADGVDPDELEFEVILPATGYVVRWGLITGKQEQAELDIEGFDPTRMQFYAIRSVNGNKDVKLRDVMSWPLRDHKALRESIAADENRLGYDTRVRFKHKSGRESVVNILLNPSFLMPGLPG